MMHGYPDTSAVGDGIAEFLDLIGVAHFTTNPAYADSPLPPVFLTPPPDQPDRVVHIRTLTEDRGTDLDNPMVLVMIRCRAVTITECRDMAAAVFGVLHERTHFQLTPTVGVSLCQREHAGEPSQDANYRWWKTDTYRLRVHTNP